MFNNHNLELLKNSHEKENQKPIGYRIKKWANSVNQGHNANRLTEAQISRDDLVIFCKNAENTTLECCISICAWGGMRRDNGRDFFANFQSLVKELDDLRTSKNQPWEDFDIIQNCQMAGMGIAYFTKLLFFLRPIQDAYILDQWTAKSINLLLDRPLIKTTSGYVSHKNTWEEYKSFCQHLNALGEVLGVSGHEAEQAIFSYGGRHPGIWRAHVRQNYEKDKFEPYSAIKRRNATE